MNNVISTTNTKKYDLFGLFINYYNIYVKKYNVNK